MSCRIYLLAATLLVADLASPNLAFGQTRLGLDASVANKYVWRGQTYRNGWVLQPSVFAYHRWPNIIATVGLWTHVEPGGIEVSDVGYGRSWGGEIDVWADVGWRIRPFDFNAGWVGYYPQVGDAIGPASRRARTHELYARFRLPRRRLTPVLGLSYDIDAVRGTFVEAGLEYRVPLWTQVLFPIGSIFVNGSVGVSLGQELNEDRASEIAYFRDRGLTQVNLSVATIIGYFAVGPTQSAVRLSFQLQINSDPYLEEVSERVDAGRDTKLWVGLTWSSVGPRCRPERSVCHKDTDL